MVLMAHATGPKGDSSESPAPGRVCMFDLNCIRMSSGPLGGREDVNARFRRCRNFSLYCPAAHTSVFSVLISFFGKSSQLATCDRETRISLAVTGGQASRPGVSP